MTNNLFQAGCSRNRILERISTSNGRRSNSEVALNAWIEIERSFQRTARRQRRQIVELFVERLIDYDAVVTRIPFVDLREAIAKSLEIRGIRNLVIPRGIETDILPDGFSFFEDTGFSATELDRFEGVLTKSSVAIAETGTIVLQNVLGQGRRALTLVPDFHLCIVLASNIVETVCEAFDKLQGTATLPTTFISGPSATADIEMTRIKGVHGPRNLGVILIQNS